MCPSTPSVQALRELVGAADASDLPDLASELARALAMVLAAHARQARTERPPDVVAAADDLLTVKQAALLLGVAPTWLYRHSKQLPFARKLGHRTLRFHRGALLRWMGTRGPADRS
jgi:excisionase family DNA binding protein